MYIIGLTLALCCFISALGRFLTRSWNGVSGEIKILIIVGLLGIGMVYYDITSPVIISEKTITTTKGYKYNLGCGLWKIKLRKVSSTRPGAIYRYSNWFKVIEQKKKCVKKYAK